MLWAILMFVTVNALFYFKYAYRLSLIAGIVSVIIYVGFIALLLLYWGNIRRFIPNKAAIGLIILSMVACAVALCFVPKEQFRVDRWEIVELFWDSVKQGLYPYSQTIAESGNPPGAMPFYFLLCYPFQYLIGEMGYMPVLAILIWLSYTYIRHKKDSFSLITLLMLSSFPLYWEIFTRSTIFFNAVLFALFVLSLKNFGSMPNRLFYLSAIVGGLLFSTRNVFVLTLVPWGLYVLFVEKVPFIRCFKWAICFVAAFAASFLPVILINPSEFFTQNAFIIQGSFLMPFALVLVFVLLSAAAFLLCKRFADVVFYGGGILFITIVGYGVYHLFANGIQAYLDAQMDISYFLFAFPFLLEVIADYKPAIKTH